ncbi:MAG: alpha/beta hydrolase [Myxococcales bacterium]|nr:alpha/beta hydrolase [Myxococcales bacterium]
MSEHLPCVEVEPERGAASAAVIWLHGLGADGHDFEPVVPLLGLPHARFVFPHAPPIPVTINGGWVMRAWYDIRTLEQRPDREDPRQIRASAARIAALLDRERARGIPSARIVLAGFSQGGAMALYTGLRYPAALAGLIALSAYMLLPETLPAELAPANQATPALLAHGRFDDLVPPFAGRAAHDQVRALPGEREVEWHEYPIGHEVSPPELAAVAAWLQRRIPPIAR